MTSGPLSKRTVQVVALGTVFVVAALARLWFAAQVWLLPESFLLNADAAVYHHLGLVIGGYENGSLPDVFELSPLTTIWNGVLHLLFGPSPLVVVGAQILLGSLGVVIAAMLSWRLAGPVAGIATGGLLAVCKPLLLYDTAIAATSLSVFLTTVTLYLTVVALETGRPKHLIFLGVSAGLWALCRPNALLFAPLFLFFFIRSRPPRLWVKTALFAAALLLTIAPVTLHNTIRGDSFVGITASGGINFFIGNNQGATGRHKPTFGDQNAKETFALFKSNAENRSGGPLTRAEISRFWYRQTAAEIADKPLRSLWLLARKGLYAINNFEVGSLVSLPFLEVIVLPLYLPAFSFAAICALGLPGLFLLRRGRPSGFSAVLICSSVTLLTLLGFFVVGRLRAPLFPPLAVGAGATVAYIASQLSLARRQTERSVALQAVRPLLYLCLAVVTASLISSAPILHPDHGPDVRRLSLSYMESGDHIEALERMKMVLIEATSQEDTELQRLTQYEIGRHLSALQHQ